MPEAPGEEHGGYWVSWFFATATTGLLAGFLVGHSLILGRFFSWMVASGRQQMLAETYAVFRQEDGVRAYMGLLGLQTLATLAFLVAGRLKTGRFGIETLPALASPLWYAVHFGSGFATVEPAVVGGLHPVSPELASRFVSWNLPIHVFATGLMLAALAILLIVPLRSMRHP